MAAALLAFHRLGAKPLWLDETVTLTIARRSLPHLVAALAHHDANAGLYYFVLHWWLRFGHGASWARLPSALAFVVTAGLAARAATAWRGPRVGLACGLLLASNPFLLCYGQEARPYALAVLAAVVSTIALFRGRDYVVSTVVLLYLSLWSLPFVLIVGWRRRDAWLRISLLGAPLALLVLLQRAQISWLPRPSSGDLVRTFTAMGGGWLGLVLLVVLAVVGWRRDWGLAFVGPPIALWLLGQLLPAFTARYVIFSTLALIGLAALGFVRVRPRGFAAVLLAAAVTLGFHEELRQLRRPFKYENPPAVVGFVAARVLPGDAVAFSGGGLRTLVDYYGGVEAADVALAGASRDIYPAQISAATLSARLRSVDRVWMITDPSDHRFPSYGPFAGLRSSFASAFSPATEASFPGIDVTLYVESGRPQSFGG